MRILFIANSNGMAEGSVIALLSIIEEMHQRGHEILVSFPTYGEAQRKCELMGVKTDVVMFCDSIYPIYTTVKSFLAIPYKIVRNCWQNKKAVVRIMQLISDFNPDVVHTNVGTINVGYYAARQMGVPHVWHIREMAEANLGWHPFPTMGYKKRLQSTNDENIAITQEVFDFYCLSSLNSCIIYDGVFNRGQIPQILPNKEKYFLFVGRICKGKGTRWAVEAFSNVIKFFPDYKLLIVGEGGGSYAEELQNACKADSLVGKVLFLGFRKDVYKLMQNATALLVPSEREGFGFITAEAMYNGCLVIGRKTGGTKEQFDNGLKTTGDRIGLEFETVKQLENAMIEVCTKGIGSYLDMVIRAQKTVLSLYTVENNVNQIITVYDNLKKCIYDKTKSKSNRNLFAPILSH